MSSRLQLRRIFILLLVVGLSNAGLVHRRNAKESIDTSSALDLRKDQIPVTVLLESDAKPQIPIAEIESTTNLKTELPAEAEPSRKDLSQDIKLKEESKPELLKEIPIENIPQESDEKKLEEVIKEVSDQSQSQRRKDEIVNDDERIDANEQEIITETLLKQELANGEQQDSAAFTATAAALPQKLEADTNVKVLADPIEGDNDNESILQPVASLNDDYQRQATQPTPTQTSTQQNFVQQLIQNSPIGQFLSQFTGGQQQQQQNQQQADEPATPQPTLPGFLNPAAAITSAQQAVQNAAQTVVNSTTQAFQGLQQFATNLGSQFQNTFANLAGQQNQLSTSDSTTTRPPGPIQAIVSNFIGNNPNAEGSATAAPGPLQGILGLFQGGNRPQGTAANTAAAATTAPPKEEPVKKPGVDDKIEMQPPQNDPILDKPAEEPDSVNEVRSSSEVINEDSSFEDGPAEDLIVVNDDANQQSVGGGGDGVEAA